MQRSLESRGECVYTLNQLFLGMLFILDNWAQKNFVKSHLDNQSLIKSQNHPAAKNMPFC